MTYKPIVFNKATLSVAHKILFSEFSTHIHYGDRIGIIGCNGSGKSSLLNLLVGSMELAAGEITVPEQCSIGYVPQIINAHDNLSGGQRFQASLTNALISNPSLLLLDEPTNHLDAGNRRSLMNMLRRFHGSVLVASHDVELLRSCVDSIWHIDQGRIDVFAGSYDDFLRERETMHKQTADAIKTLKMAKKKVHQALQEEQQRNAQSKRVNQHENDRKLKGAMREWGSSTTGKNKGKLNRLKNNIQEKRQALYEPKIIIPKFSLKASDLSLKHCVEIRDGRCGYGEAAPILCDIQLTIGSRERVALVGDNGVGKSTLIKALLHQASIIKTGTWITPQSSDIGYLDQHYHNLDYRKTVFDTIKDLIPDESDAFIRVLLNDFLFRTNKEVEALVETLSGGEKARLSLACIAVKTPNLLLLDEITNNVDLETQEHITRVLTAYPGAFIVISHDQHFLQTIGIEKTVFIENGVVGVKRC